MKENPYITNTSEQGYKLTPEECEALWELEKPLEKILDALRKEIERGAYGFIVGDDASGRIPTLIVGKVLKDVYENKGLKAPLIRFIAGSSSLEREEKSDRQSKYTMANHQIQKIKNETSQNGIVPSKALIVTDTVSAGRSIEFLLDALKKQGLSADVATIGVTGDSLSSGYRRELENRWNTNIVYAMKWTPGIYRERMISGVRKSDKDLFSKPNKRFELDPASNQEKINAAREIAHKIADKVFQHYQKNPPD